jgi:hypothetical protein
MLKIYVGKSERRTLGNVGELGGKAKCFSKE